MELRNNIIKLVLAFVAFSSFAFMEAQDIVILEEEKASQYIPPEEEAKKLTFFQGFSLSVDLFPLGQKLLTDFGGAEASLKLNLYNTFFPTFELGFSSCDHTDGNTKIQYKTNAPYLRAGVDFNLLKNKFQDNKLFVGARYGFSNYNFDISGPEITDPYWGGSSPFSYTDINTTSHWFEIVAGAQVKIFKHFHMGWIVRFKREINSTKNDYAQPYYIPGYGTTSNSTTWGASYNLTFDLNWGKKGKEVPQY